MWFVNRQEMFF